MIRFKQIALLLLAALCGACSSDDTDKTLQLQRNALLESQQIGIYCQGEPLLLFDKTKHQLYIDPNEALFRIQDDLGQQYVEIDLSGLPTTNGPATGTIRGTFAGITETQLSGVVLLNNASGQLWLWTDNGRWGMIVPWPRF